MINSFPRKNTVNNGAWMTVLRFEISKNIFKLTDSDVQTGNTANQYDTLTGKTHQKIALKRENVLTDLK